MEIASFAAQRNERLAAADEDLAPHVNRALARFRLGIQTWDDDLVAAASQLWLEHFQAEAPGANHASQMARFQESLREWLANTSKPAGDVLNAQVDRITYWLSGVAVNSGTVTGAYARGVRFKRWVTMSDADVRDIHQHLDGRTVPIGSTFNVAGTALPYPAFPKGPPEAWIQCRCLAMPASREGETMSANTFMLGPDDEIEEDEIVRSNNLTAAGDLANPDGTPYTGALVVLVPANTDPIVAASSEPAHVTTIWFGEMESIAASPVDLQEAVESYAATLNGPVIVPVRERGTLGEDDADVVFLEPTDSLVALRDGLLERPEVRAAHDAAEQFPEWTPHVTLGYPDRPARGEYDATEVTFDRISLWLGGEHYDYPMGGGAVTAAATGTFDMAGVVADVDDVETDDIPDDEPEDGEELITEIPIHGVLAPEGVASGDRRGFRKGALSTRPLPLPFRYEYVSSHGGNRTSEVATVGRIDKAWLDEASGHWRFTGAIVLSRPYAQAAIDDIIDGTGTGISIDADDMAIDTSEMFDAEGNPIERDFDMDDLARGEMTWYSETRVAGATQVPIPAFHEAYVGLGHEFPEDMTEEQLTAAARALEDCGCPDEASQDGMVASGEFAPGTKDGPGWITHPVATSRIRRYWVRGAGAAKIGWGRGGDFYRCRNQLAKYVQNPEWLSGLCANMHREAIGIWPGQHDAHSIRQGLVASGEITAEPALAVRLVEPETALVASGGRVYSAAAFAEPKDRQPFPLRIDREARTISGYAAQWGTCHIGVMGMCQDVPRSASNYSYFRKGLVQTDAGEQHVGLLTYGIGHAGERFSAAAATAHYDQTDAVRAYINVGENAMGLWYAGVLAPWVTDDDIDAMLAIRRVSGDWRNWSGRRNDLEMVGLVVVNTEGFQLAASGGIQTTAIGLGVVEPDREQPAAGETFDEFKVRVAEYVSAHLRHQERQEKARARAFALRQAEVRRRINERI